MLRRASVTVLLLVLLPATVHAFDHHHRHRSGSSGGDGCGSSTSSSSGSGSATPSLEQPPLPTNHKRVFVTSTTYSGALGGLTAADAHCQSSASTHGLSGTFRAWVSDKTTDAYDRFENVGPWYTTSDALAFSEKTDLLGAPKSVLLDEYSGYPEAAGAWSGSDARGVATGQDCDGWTNATAAQSATTGGALGSDTAWGGGGAPVPCDAKASLICFQL